MPVSHLNLMEADAFDAGVPHDYFRWLREHEPVHWNPGRPERQRAALKRLPVRFTPGRV